MNEERKKILEMLSEGKITAEDAERLLDKIEAGRIRQGLDLQGGMYLVLEVDQEGMKPDEARDAHFGFDKDNVTKTPESNGLNYAFYTDGQPAAAPFSLSLRCCTRQSRDLRKMP